MKYKALILDIDGTTIPKGIDQHPRPRVLEAIRQAKKTVHVSVSTSRPLFIAKDLIREIGIDGPCAVNDSTQFYDPVKDVVIQTIYLPPDTAKKIVEILSGFTEKFLVNNGDSEFEYAGETLPDHVCGFCIPDVSLARADELIAIISKIPNVAAGKVPGSKDGICWFTATHALATKLHSVVTIAELLGIHPDDIIGVGDGYNDYPLLSACGLKIAMGNAVPELKVIADFIAPSVDEDGVATVIEKFILNQ